MIRHKSYKEKVREGVRAVESPQMEFSSIPARLVEPPSIRALERIQRAFPGRPKKSEAEKERARAEGIAEFNRLMRMDPEERAKLELEKSVKIEITKLFEAGHLAIAEKSTELALGKNADRTYLFGIWMELIKSSADKNELNQAQAAEGAGIAIKLFGEEQGRTREQIAQAIVDGIKQRIGNFRDPGDWQKAHIRHFANAHGELEKRNMADVARRVVKLSQRNYSELYQPLLNKLGIAE